MNTVYGPAKYDGQTGRLADSIQGSLDTHSITWMADATTPRVLVGPLTGIIVHRSGVYAIGGALTVTSANNGRFDWIKTEADVGLHGPAHVIFTDGVNSSFAARWNIVESPSVTAVLPEPLTGLSPVLAAALAGTGANDQQVWTYDDITGPGWQDSAGGGSGMPLITEPVTGDLVTQAEDGTLAKAGVSPSDFDAAGSATAVANDLTAHEALTTAAHGGLLPQSAGITTVSTGRELQAADAGKILECDGTFTVTAPNGLATGFQCVIVNVGSGAIDFAAATTLQGKGATLAEQYGAATIYHRGGDVWLVFGDLS